LSGPVALYVHVPFCLSICPYCDFVVFGGGDAKGPTNRIPATVDALATEIALRAADHPTDPLRSVYFGGGTPSLLSAKQLAYLLDTVQRTFALAADAEITLECNPGPADRGDLAGFRAAGVNRLSIGAQSFDAVELRTLGRRHSAADIAATVDAARRAGFDNVSIDLLYDVPGQTLDSWQRTLDATIALLPEHVSAYALTLDDPDAEGLTGPAGDHLPLRAGARRWRAQAIARQDESFAADAYSLAEAKLSAAGYGWYEISNWARPGFESRHNLVYWSGFAWDAVGPGAHAYDGASTRSWNASALTPYLSALAARQLPPGGAEIADEPTALAELVILSLRRRVGLDRGNMSAALEPALAWGEAVGLLEPTASGGLCLSLSGRLLANELFVRMVAADGSAARAGETTSA
jgi:oxygen-independent coproporphyrinogen-3 oxidase